MVLIPIFSWVLAATLRASLLVLVILLLQRLLRSRLSARWKYGVWAPVLLAILIPAQPLLPYWEWPVANESRTTSHVDSASSVAVDGSPEVDLGFDHPATPSHSDVGAVQLVEDSSASAADISTATPANSEVQAPLGEDTATAFTNVGESERSKASNQSWNWRAMLAAGWLLGAVCLSGVVWISYARALRGIRREAISVEQADLGRVQSLAKELGLRRTPKVWLSPEVKAPAVCGALRPMLLLNDGFFQMLSREEADFVLKHELMHIRRGDVFLNSILFGLLSLHWFNPLLWYAFARAKADREAACDEDVLLAESPARRVAYGKTLLRMEAELPESGLCLGFVGMVQRGKRLRERIQFISNPKRMAFSMKSLVLLGMCVTTILGIAKSAEPQSKPQTHPSTLATDQQIEESKGEAPQQGPLKFRKVKNAAEPIRLANVAQLGLLSETKRPAWHIKLVPGSDELLFFSPFSSPEGIEVVDDKNFKVLRRIDQEQIQGFTVSGDRSMTSWIRGKTLVIRHEKTGKTLESEAGHAPQKNDPKVISHFLGTVVFSPDNKVVAVSEMISTEGAENAGYSLLRVFDAKSGEMIRKLEITKKGEGGLTQVFSPDGRTLAVGNRNYETKLFDTDTWNLQHTLPKRMTHEIAFSPDSKTFAAGYVDGSLGLWDVESGKRLHMVDTGCGSINSIAWNSTGDLLATSGYAGQRRGPNKFTHIEVPGKVLLWNAKTCEVVRELMDIEFSGSVRFTRDDTRLISTFTKKRTLDDSPRIAVWSTNAPATAAVAKPKVDVPAIPVERSLSLDHPGISWVAVSPDGKRVVAPEWFRNGLEMWNFTTGEREFLFKDRHNWTISQIAFSPDGSTVATASHDKTAMLWDSKTGDLLATMKGHTYPLRFVTFSPAGKYILTGTRKNWPYSQLGTVSARIWDAKTGKPISELETHVDTIISAKFSRDETRVLTSSRDHTAKLWEVASGKELHTFDHGSWIQTIDFSRDGKTILTSSNGRPSEYLSRDGENRAEKPSMKLWDATTGKLRLDKPHLQAVTASFNEAGDQILTESRGLITYWDAKSGEKLTTLREPLIGTKVVFCPNGKYFVVITQDEPLEVWSISDQKPIARMKSHMFFLSFFSRDSQTFYSLTRNGDFRSWSLDGLEPEAKSRRERR